MTSPYLFAELAVGNERRPAVLFLHGFLGCREDWLSTIGAFAGDYFCVAPDLPGHGDTRVYGPDSLYDMEHTGAAIIEHLARKSLERVHLVGYSMGGRLALYLAVNYPQWCGRVVIEAGSPGLDGKKERAERRIADNDRADRLEREGLDAFIEAWYQQALFAGLATQQDEFSQMIIRRRRSDPAGLARSLRQMGSGVQPSLWAHLPQIELPVLFVAGADDEKFATLARRQADLCPLGEHRIIAASGHVPHVEQPTKFATIVREFIGRK